MEPRLFSFHGLPLRIRSFVDFHFKSPDDLSKTPALLSKLENDCNILDRDIDHLADKLQDSVKEWEILLGDVKEILHSEVLDFADWKGRRRVKDGPEMGSVGLGSDLVVELSVLAKEIQRIKMVRTYAETTLRLEALVGDLEDAAFSYMSQKPNSTISVNLSNQFNSTDFNFKYKHEKILGCIKAMRDIEDALIMIVKFKPNWNHLISAVDSRVETILGILKPQALRDHRTILLSLGWPPLLTVIAETDSANFPNPLVLMQGDKKEKFSQSFLALCALQHVVETREGRRSKLPRADCARTLDIVLKDDGLWTIDELVLPLSSRMEQHFSKWSEEPKFIFALVYKISRDFLEGVENVLQPLIDTARLVGYSAKETWILAMSKMLSGYLKSSVFPGLVDSYDADNENQEVITSFLLLIDHIISFDKRMLALASSGTVLKGMHLNFDVVSLPTLLYLTFHDHIDWLQIWAEIELRDAEGKLKIELEDQKFWFIDIKEESEFCDDKESETFLLSSREDFRAPPIAESILKIAWSMIERCQVLPSISMRLQFIRSSACVLLQWFYKILLQRSEGTESLTAVIVESEALRRLIGVINAARYCDSAMQEWSEDVNLIELGIFAQKDAKNEQGYETYQIFFQEEISKMAKLETDCLVNIMSSLLLEFEFLSRDYIRNKEPWQSPFTELGVDGDRLNVSNMFVESLELLTECLRTLKSGLNSKDFADLWRSIAGGLDHFMFFSIILNNVKFSSYGLDQLKVDMEALFLVFRPFCARPAAFFPYLSESLKLLSLSMDESECFTGLQFKNDKEIQDFLRLHGVSHISPNQAREISMSSTKNIYLFSPKTPF